MEAITEYFANLETATLIGWAWKFVGAILIFIIGRLVVKLISTSLGKVMGRRGMDPMLVSFLGTVVYVTLLVAVVIAAIGYTGVQITPLIAILGAAGLAVAFALQSSLSNLASGVMLVSFHPFGVGDFVEAGGVAGTVLRVGIFNTVLTTPDNRRIIVPNSLITEAAIINYSANHIRRVDLIIGVHYEDDLAVAREAIAGVLQNHEKVLNDPEPVIFIMDLGESSVDFAVRPWVETGEYWVVRGELLEQLKTALESAGCSIPFPQRDMHIIREPGETTEPEQAA